MERSSNSIPKNLAVPAGWTVVPLRHLFVLSGGYQISRSQMDSQGMPCIHYGDIHGRYGFSVDINSKSIGRVDNPEEFGVTSFVGQGDFLFAGSSEDLEGSGNFTLVEGEGHAIAGSDTIIVHSPLIEAPRFFAYQFDSLFVREQIRSQLMGVKVFHPSQRTLKLVRLLLPPVPEQFKIAKFLDAKTAEIDDLLDALQRQRKLLARYKRELIAHVVTKGLDHDVPMKDSCSAWIGEIPKHWDLLSLKNLLTRQSQKGKPSWRVLSVERDRGIVDRKSEGSPDNHNRLPDDLSKYLVVHKNQFVMNKMKAWQGSYGVSAYNGIVSPAYFVFDLAPSINADFFNWAIRSASYIPFFGRDSYGIRTDQWDFKIQALRNIPIIVPPKEEQIIITKYLFDRVSKIDSLITDIGHQVKLLEKYRKQVINDVVTGKVHVGEETA